MIQPLNPLPRFVAGVDAAFSTDMKTVLAAAVVYDRIERKIIEVRHADRPVLVPYIPGFLSFREGPAVLAAIVGKQCSTPSGAFETSTLADHVSPWFVEDEK